MDMAVVKLFCSYTILSLVIHFLFHFQSAHSLVWKNWIGWQLDNITSVARLFNDHLHVFWLTISIFVKIEKFTQFWQLPLSHVGSRFTASHSMQAYASNDTLSGILVYNSLIVIWALSFKLDLHRTFASPLQWFFFMVMWYSVYCLVDGVRQGIFPPQRRKRNKK